MYPADPDPLVVPKLSKKFPEPPEDVPVKKIKDPDFPAVDLELVESVTDAPALVPPVLFPPMMETPPPSDAPSPPAILMAPPVVPPNPPERLKEPPTAVVELPPPMLDVPPIPALAFPPVTVTSPPGLLPDDVPAETYTDPPALDVDEPTFKEMFPLFPYKPPPSPVVKDIPPDIPEDELPDSNVTCPEAPEDPDARRK
jgi:hypothetical protein